MRQTRTPYRRRTSSIDMLALIVLKSTHSLAITSLFLHGRRWLELNQLIRPQLDRCWPCRCWNICQLREEVVEGGYPIVNSSDLLFAQRNRLTETEQVRFAIAPCSIGGWLR